MSSGAELAVVAAPVAGVATLAVGALALAAGAVAVGGIALVGVGRLGIAAGAYAADQLNKRANACANEYARYQQLRAQALAAKLQQGRVLGQSPVIPAPTTQFGTSSWSQYHQNQQVGERLAAELEHELSARQQRYAERIDLIERRAHLSAALALDGDLLAPDIARRARQAATEGSLGDVTAMIDTLRAATARSAGEELAREQATLRDHYAEVTGLLAIVVDQPARAELLNWQLKLNGMLNSTDIGAIRNRLREGAQLLASCRMRHELAQAEVQSAVLAEVYGQLEATRALFKDLQALRAAELVALDPAHITRLQELGARYEDLASAPAADLAALRAASRALQQALRALQHEGVRLLNACYQTRLADEVEASMREMTLDGAPFDSIERGTTADGNIVLKARQGRRRLTVRVRPNARMKYEAHGFGDEGCLHAVYGLLDRLIDRDVQLEVHEPRLTNQVSIALRVIEALKELGHYSEEQITVREDAAAVVIEAGKQDGPAFQRTRIVVDEQGDLREEQTNIMTAKGFTKAYQAAEAPIQEREAKLKRHYRNVAEQRRRQRQQT
jgi:hypothetical protein